MTARLTMVDIIANLRLLVDDPAGTGALFSDDQLQAVLDGVGEDVRYRPLTGLDAISGGQWVILTYASYRYPYEGGATLTDGSYSELTPATADLMSGRWTFAAHTPQAYVTGRVYDVNGAAGRVWELKAAKYAAEFDFAAGGASYKLSQKHDHAVAQARLYRRLSWTVSGMNVITRSDTNA